MYSQYRLSVLQWNPGPVRKNDTQIILEACGRFHAVILQEAGGSRVTHHGPLQHLHGRQRPRHPAQQRHVRVRLRCLPCLRGLHKQRHMGTCCTCRAWRRAPPFHCRLTHGHVLLRPPPQQSRHEPLFFTASTHTWCSTTSTSLTDLVAADIRTSASVRHCGLIQMYQSSR